MKTIGSHPGAILFRLSIMAVLIAIIVVVFLSYVEKVQKNAELAGIIRTKGIVDSSLVLLFATYATQGRLNELNDLDGANPFDLLPEYNLLPPSYRGEINYDLNDELAPGWYYLSHRREAAYKSRYLNESFRYQLTLEYDDKNQSSRFEPGIDSFGGVYFIQVKDPD